MSEVIVRLTSDRIKIQGGAYVQDLVRCSECKHGEYWDGFNEYECHTNKYAIRHKPDFFCADGEVRDE